MRKYILSLLVFVGFNTYCHSQNLQFSKAIYHKFKNVTGCNTNGVCILDTFTLVVPSNKVVKLESASANSALDSLTQDFLNSIGIIALDGIALSNFTYSTTVIKRDLFPIWLPEGVYRFTLVSGTSSNTNLKGFISGIEYTLSN